MELRLSGLVVIRENRLRVYNRIYAQVFDPEWTEQALETLRPYAENFNAWNASKCQDGSRLLCGQALKDAEEWAQNRSLSDDDHRFLFASREAEQKAVENALKAEKAEIQEEQIRIQRQRNRILAAFLAISLMIGGFAFWQWQEARFHQKQAEKQSELRFEALTRAEKQKELALDAINTLTYELVDELAQIPRTTRIVTRVLKSNTDVLDRIYALDPDTRKARREKASALSRLGNSWLLLGKTDQALKAYQQSNEILGKLAKADPENTSAQRDLSVSHNRLGNVRLKLGDTAGALEAYQQDLEISRELAAKDPENTSAQRDLSVSHYKMGELHKALKNQKAALQAYQNALAIAQELAKDTVNQQAQNDLRIILNELSSLASQLKKYNKAAEYTQLRIDHSPEPDAGAFGSLSWYLLFAGKPEQAIQAAEKGLSIDPEQTWITTNLVSGHLFSGNMEKAKQIFRQHADKKLEEESFAQVMLNDFKAFEEAGITRTLRRLRIL